MEPVRVAVVRGAAAAERREKSRVDLEDRVDLGFVNSCDGGGGCMLAYIDHHFLQDQYRAVSLSFALAQSKRLRKAALRFGLCFFMRMFGSP